jgi:hypothetical protein
MHIVCIFSSYIQGIFWQFASTKTCARAPTQPPYIHTCIHTHTYTYQGTFCAISSTNPYAHDPPSILTYAYAYIHICTHTKTRSHSASLHTHAYIHTYIPGHLFLQFASTKLCAHAPTQPPYAYFLLACHAPFCSGPACMCRYMYVCVYAYICSYAYCLLVCHAPFGSGPACMYRQTYVSVCMRRQTQLTHIHTLIYIYIHIYIYICMYVYIYVYIICVRDPTRTSYTYIHACMHVYLHLQYFMRGQYF